jgi:hypothetical protein
MTGSGEQWIETFDAEGAENAEGRGEVQGGW